MQMVSSVPVAQQAMMIMMNEPLLKKLCVLLCMPENAPEWTPEHLKLPRFSGGAYPQTSYTEQLQVSHVLYSANDIAPPDGKS